VLQVSSQWSSRLVTHSKGIAPDYEGSKQRQSTLGKVHVSLQEKLLQSGDMSALDLHTHDAVEVAGHFELTAAHELHMSCKTFRDEN